MNTECETIRDIVTAYGEGIEEVCVKLIDGILESGGENAAESVKRIYSVIHETHVMFNKVSNKVSEIKDRIRIIEAIL